MSFADFDFALSKEQEARSRRLHADNIVVDLMFQGPCGYRSISDEMLGDVRMAWDDTHSSTAFVSALVRITELAGEGKLPDYEAIWRESGLTASNLQVLGNPKDGGHLPRLKEFASHPSYSQILTADDIRRAKGEGRYGSFLNYQYLPDMPDVGWLGDSWDVGVRMAGLTYNAPNQIGAGCTSDDQGLTPFGREVISEMNSLGILVDVAHAGPRTTIEACSQSKVPVVASHAAASALFPHARCKSDDELRAIADSGGLCGVLAAPVILTNDPPGDINLTLDHIDHIANTIGIDAVAVGSDWPLQLPKWILEPDGPLKAWLGEMGFTDEQVEQTELNLRGFDDYRDFPNITRGLVARGYSDEDIAKVLGGNAMRVFEAVWR
jgi:membrane dipeptidase